VDEGPFADVDPDMVVLMFGVEEDQIARPNLISGDAPPDLYLRLG
jgi:hypothetical protein